MEQALDKRQIRQEILRLAVPTVLENMLQMVAKVVIAAMVGRLLAGDIAAQGMSDRLYSIVFSLFKGFATGAMVIVATHYGAGRLEKCRRAVEQMYLACVPIASLLALLIMVFPMQLLSFFTKDAALLAAAAAYSRITVWAIPFMTIISVNTAAFNGHGDTRTPMLIATFMNVVNICVGYVLIFGLGGLGGWGLTGAAVATVITQVTGCAAGLVILYHRGGILRRADHGQRFFSFDWRELKDIFTIGIPTALENCFWQFATSILSRVILGYGENYYAAYQLGLQAEMLCEMPAMGFVTAMTTLSARAIGKRDGPLFRAYYRTMLKMAGFLAVVAMALLLLLPRQLMMILTDKPVLQELGQVYVIVMGFAQVPQILARVLYGTILAAGGKRVPMVATFVGIWMVRIPMVLICNAIGTDIIWIWVALDLDHFFRLGIGLLYMWRKDVKNTVEHMEAQAQITS